MGLGAEMKNREGGANDPSKGSPSNYPGFRSMRATMLQDTELSSVILALVVVKMKWQKYLGDMLFLHSPRKRMRVA
jgi:hypothetical protein